MYIALIILFVLASILMCLIVLIQNSKGGGLASGFSSSNQIMGVRKTTDFLEKTTWGLAIFMVVMSIAIAWVLHTAPSTSSSVIERQAIEQSKTNPINLPTGNAAQPLPAANDAPATDQQQPAQ